MRGAPLLWRALDLEMAAWRSDGPGALSRMPYWRRVQAVAWASLRADGIPSIAALSGAEVAQMLSAVDTTRPPTVNADAVRQLQKTFAASSLTASLPPPPPGTPIDHPDIGIKWSVPIT